MAALRGIVAGLLIIPLAALVLPQGVDFHGVDVAGLRRVPLAGAFAGAAIGLVLGTVVQPTRINVVFAVVLTPLLFTGCTFYPWQSLYVAALVPGLTLATRSPTSARPCAAR